MHSLRFLLMDRCPGVFTASSLPVLTNFFHRLKTGGGGREGREDGTASLKTLSASKNGFRSPSMETLSSTLAARWLPALLSLDLSDNPLGPFGVRALVRGLSAPLQCLGLARTGAKEKGVEALAEVLKEKRVTSLQTLDLNENEIFAGCFKHLAAALCTAGAVPFLKVLLLKNNSLTHTKEADEENDRDYGPLSMVLSTDQLGELEQLDLSENKLFDEPIGVEGASDRRVSAPAIAAAGRLLKLRILNLANTKIKSGELAALMNAVDGGGVPFLEDLCLSGSQRGGGGEGMQALANTVHSGRLSGVTVLSLCSCSEFSGNAARSLFEAVADGKTPLLSRVEIGPNNRFCQQENYDAAVQTLGRALREGRVPRMEALILNFQIDESASPQFGGGILELAEALGGGNTPLLEDLDLCDWCQGGKGGAELGEVLSTGKAPSLRRVRLGWPANQMLVALCEGQVPSLSEMNLCVDTKEDLRSFQTLVTNLNSPHAASLRQMWVHFSDVYGDTFESALVATFSVCLASEHLSRLQVLEVRLIEESNVAVFSLCTGLSSGKLSSLRELTFVRVSFESEAAALSSALDGDKLPSLRVLRLIECALNDAGLGELRDGWMNRRPPPLAASTSSG
uniref:Uncharacterized protein n=1 Tax=Chromera velia CCMP2878 TaxID=1169474 RepID=A0A0G4FD74_9ALVE|eukprot:Cvel_16317.t1-p1 / transcript=Cvel_16317.t1 / gene=Cvel_16317 / organism=Chromera_velia_CCMP2878 / gene_product=hypothetical protein / transcript_product=hypothetical protein / location=Cvel_scaffold1252:15042-19130(-) / protein_length=624 / sequence_SO=supercontig / SO=protein_coding / is_pseudo=false